MDLDPRILGRLEAQSGVGSVTELVELGVSRHVVDRAVHAGLLIRLRRNVVVLPQLWNAAAPWDRHALRARGTARAWRGSPFALSHHSALALLGIPLYGVDHRVHIVPRRNSLNRTGTATQIHTRVDEADLVVVDDIHVVDGPVATMQVAATFGVEAGLVSADGLLLHRPDVDLTVALERAPVGNGRAKAALVAALADGRSESAGESRCRWSIRAAGLPTPEMQTWIDDRDGFSARVDFLFRAERVIVEFDGLLKYQSPRDLHEEKAREDRLRRMGYEVVRIVWADLQSPARVKHLILEAFARSRSRAA
ncbi:MAG: DUF559 domain-containing protein [Ornithinimicrobium sp.]